MVFFLLIFFLLFILFIECESSFFLHRIFLQSLDSLFLCVAGCDIVGTETSVSAKIPFMLFVNVRVCVFVYGVKEQTQNTFVWTIDFQAYHSEHNVTFNESSTMLKQKKNAKNQEHITLVTPQSNQHKLLLIFPWKNASSTPNK